MKIVIRKQEKELSSLQETIAKLEKSLQTSLLQYKQSDAEEKPIADSIESVIRQQFDQQQTKQSMRIELATAKLKLVEVRRQLRRIDQESIIQKTLQSLLEP